MRIIMGDVQDPPGGVEVVEHKGIGHPDTLCDGIAEAWGRALCRFYLERFDTVVHHNVDKALLFAGTSLPAFGGGRVSTPIDLFLAGRVTTEVGGVRVPVAELAEEAARAWLRAHLRFVDPDAGVRVHCLSRGGSADLRTLFDDASRANDTSIGVGRAPATELERAVLAVEPRLRAAHCVRPELGEDVKVMAVRDDRTTSLTLSVAMVDRFLPDPAAYEDAREAVARIAGEVLPWDDVAVNAADDPSVGRYYLTVTGTSAESGDDGQVGRGNRVNGLITPCRPMSMEAAAGKNPVTHVGKLYNLVAGRAAEAMVALLPDVLEARVLLVSRIGRALDDPWVAEVRLQRADGAPGQALAEVAGEILANELGSIPELTRALIAGTVPVH